MPKKPEIAPGDGICLEAEYGTQRDNPVMSGGKLTMHGWADCGPEMCAGIISQDIPGATDNAYVMALLKDMEPDFSPDGWGTHMLPVFRREPWYQGGRLSQYVETHAAYAAYKTGKAAVVRKYDGQWNEIIAMLEAGRQVGFCSAITGSGHFIRIVGCRWDEKNGLLGFYVHDPYGEADQSTRGQYKSADGAYVFYPLAWLKAGRCWGDPAGQKLTFFYTR